MELTTRPRSAAKRWALRCGAALLTLCGALTGLAWYTGKFDHNLREVSPGKVYRSAQMDGAEFKSVIAEKKLKAVLNLRGESPNSAWYPSELAACLEAGVEHADFNIGLGVLPKPDALRALIAKLETGPYPLLMHCRAGADRSSLGAVFYLYFVEHVPLEVAEASQMNWRYGHFALGDARSIDEFFKLYHDSAHGLAFKEWVLNVYPKLYDERHGALSKN
jgi:protein tyrosine phosphatase (PTP) superfamily phosphohydrolase (DUF442 family)